MTFWWNSIVVLNDLAYVSHDFNLHGNTNYQCWNRSSVVQIRHGDFRLRISQDEEDIQSVLDWYNRLEFIFHIKNPWRHFLRFGLGKQDVSNLFEILPQSHCFFRVDAVFLDHLSQDIRGTNSSAVWRYLNLICEFLSSLRWYLIILVLGCLIALQKSTLLIPSDIS